MADGVLELGALVAELGVRRARGARIVLTNGVFDLLHVGHLRYLRAARQLGDLLVVGVNSDESVRGLKPGRPLIPASERAELVAGLKPVDYVVLFCEATAGDLITQVRPATYVKGGDYAADALPEAAAARAVGARVAIVPLVPGHSTTLLLERLRR